MSEFSDAFLSEAERHAAWGAAQLQALTGFLPQGPWTADLPACLYRQGEVELRIAVLGTYDAEDHSWMWGWANAGLRGTPVVALTEEIEGFGRCHGIAEFTAGTLDLSGFADPRRAAETLAFAGMGVTGALGYIGMPAGPTTQVYFLPDDDPQVPRVGLDPVALPRTLMTGVSLLGHSARQVVTGYFEHHGVPWRGDDHQVRAQLPGGTTAEIDFDASGRIAAIRLPALR
ncbi:DUF6882 domain-containing protein [Streptomyces hiroshimensis]|uniref:Uncharacterized protein n=1 Tax=Streptomyces hiroshimensis TaxID=66424 RepID=A0ABQ2Y4A8_9ACTN|nr:DUF6882 domain-containing protein [Streptomyces hiroshimensis]GGX63997.1 hypothetical protein GCM10010324_06010 [Streptomyces hiroshimensis]